MWDISFVFHSVNAGSFIILITCVCKAECGGSICGTIIIIVVVVFLVVVIVVVDDVVDNDDDDDVLWLFILFGIFSS